MADRTPEEIAEGLSSNDADALLVVARGERRATHDHDLCCIELERLRLVDHTPVWLPFERSLTPDGRAVADALVKRAEVSRG